MAYTVLARRYRSQSFGSVVGQEPIASTLINAIRSDRVAHAYLFCGTRGVGKTSMARIFARALNAPATVDDAPPPDAGVEYPQEDVQQRMAEAIMKGDDLNVIEIDGASNNSVDQARQLIANAGLSPTANAVYKIYIIDEVHMLSGAAFNALLKTMEEPPSHVKFILCTTEPHKVPATIQSRCQRFDFRNIATGKIAEHLTEVLKNETVQAESEVLWQVARLGNGSMRDALSLMDRLLATGEATLTGKILQDMLGLPDAELIADFIDALADGNIKASLTATADLLDRGIGQDQLIEVMVERLRQLMLISACGHDSDLIELSEDARPKAIEQAQRFDAPGLVHMIALCENLQRHAKSSSNPRALLDATVVRLALSEKMADVSAVLSGRAPRIAARNAGGDASGDASADDEKKKLIGERGSGAGDRGSGSHPTVSNKTKSPSPQVPITPNPESRSPVPVSDPAAVWKAVMETVGHTNAAAWMDSFRLVSLDTSVRPAVARLQATMTFAGGARNVATAPRLKRVADTITQLLGIPVNAELAESQPRDDTASVASPSGSESTNATPQIVPGTLGAASGSRGGGATPGGGVDRRDALGLPLVKDVLEIFPDASLIDARKETPSPNPPSNTIP